MMTLKHAINNQLTVSIYANTLTFIFVLIDIL